MGRWLITDLFFLNNKIFYFYLDIIFIYALANANNFLGHFDHNFAFISL